MYQQHKFDNAKLIEHTSKTISCKRSFISFKPQQNFELDLTHKIMDGNMTRNIVLNLFDLQNRDGCMRD